MADRVSVTIRIGGSLPKAKLTTFIQTIEKEALTDPIGEYFTVAHISGLETLELAANDVSWGRLEALEAFCVNHNLPFERWCGSYPGGWEAERIVFDGRAEPRAYTVTENDTVVVTASEARSLGSFDAVIAYLDSAALGLPPFTIADQDEDTGHG